MLNVFIIIAFVAWIAGFFVNGFTLYQVCLIVPTVMFTLRKFGIHVKCGTILASDILFLFFSLTWKLLFHKFVLWKLIVTLILRAIVLGIAFYDDTAYVYVTEERKRQ